MPGGTARGTYERRNVSSPVRRVAKECRLLFDVCLRSVNRPQRWPSSCSVRLTFIDSTTSVLRSEASGACSNASLGAYSSSASRAGSRPRLTHRRPFRSNDTVTPSIFSALQSSSSSFDGAGNSGQRRCENTSNFFG